MPSDELSTRVPNALADRIAAFRAAVAAVRDEMREHVEAHDDRARDTTDLAARALGNFAAGRIDPRRFGAVLTDPASLKPEAAALLARCAGVLDELLARGDALFVHRLPHGGLLRGKVDAVLAEIGRAFAAARVFQAVRRGAPPVPEHEAMLRDFPFAFWARGERDLAPPLVVAIDGADLRAEHVVEYLDGGVTILFLVAEPASPAPLVRLIAPSVLVLQTSDASALETLRAASGPAVAALLVPGSAELRHDPRGGARLEDRLRITLPTADASGDALGWRSARQARDELAQLAALAELCAAERDVSVVVVPPVTNEGTVRDDPAAVDAVAAWLLAQAGFTGGAT